MDSPRLKFPRFPAAWLRVAMLLVFAAAARAEPPDEAYFPLRVGDERISDVVFISPVGTVEKSILTVIVMEKAERDGLSYVRVHFRMEGAHSQDYTKLTRRDASGVYSLDERDPAAGEAMEIELPLKVGETQLIGAGNAKMKVTIIGQESVSTAGRTYEHCYHVQMVPPDSSFTRDMWLAPGIGSLKSETRFLNKGKMAVTLRAFRPAAK